MSHRHSLLPFPLPDAPFNRHSTEWGIWTIPLTQVALKAEWNILTTWKQLILNSAQYLKWKPPCWCLLASWCCTKSACTHNALFSHASYSSVWHRPWLNPKCLARGSVLSCFHDHMGVCLLAKWLGDREGLQLHLPSWCNCLNHSSYWSGYKSSSTVDSDPGHLWNAEPRKWKYIYTESTCRWLEPGFYTTGWEHFTQDAGMRNVSDFGIFWIFEYLQIHEIPYRCN